MDTISYGYNLISLKLFKIKIYNLASLNGHKNLIEFLIVNSSADIHAKTNDNETGLDIGNFLNELFIFY
jgi:hypothetical protein